jgi:hypothetical protein
VGIGNEDAKRERQGLLLSRDRKRLALN